MKFSAFSLGLCVFAAASVNAQYFSAGWTPGQAAPSPELTPVDTAAVPEDTPSKVAPQRITPSTIVNFFDVTKLLSSELSVSVFSQFGINITERLESAIEKTKVWDSRVPLITDDNYQDLIVNEPLTPKEEQDRTWIIVISVTTGRQDGVSLFVDQVFDEAYNQTLIEGDLPNVRWGRIDYLNVTTITTKWSIWHAPYLVVLKDRGRTLRFYKPQNLRLKADNMRNFLRDEQWKITPPWSSAYAPGGDREWILEYLAFCMTKFYNVIILIPRWMLFVLSGSIASVAINFLHKPTLPPQQGQVSLATTMTASPPTNDAAESTATSSPSKTTKRKRTKAKI
ncbi:hypothetical protein H0H87_001817 [Tephrocybe sp. NHM501043]|nr:hypothetical protein H0H87_001817 [Tephrocybe sp. NHM501043]